MKRRRWPWFAFGAAVVFTVLLSLVPPPDRFATFSDVGHPITSVEYNRLMAIGAGDPDMTIDPDRTVKELNMTHGDQGWRVRAWMLPMPGHEARRRLASCDIPSRPTYAETGRDGYPGLGKDYRVWLYVSHKNDAVVHLQENTAIPKEYGCAVLVAEAGAPKDLWQRIVWRLKSRLGIK